MSATELQLLDVKFALTSQLLVYNADTGKTDRIGVIRDAFTPFNASEAQLSRTVVSLAEGQAAVNSAAALAPQGIVIDEYIRDDQNQCYRLTHTATDLLRYALRFGLDIVESSQAYVAPSQPAFVYVALSFINPCNAGF